MPRSVVATAPVRTADVGGWTDTWFARTGAVCNVAVSPGITVRATLDPAGPPGAASIRLGDGDASPVDLLGDPAPDADRLLVAALRSVPLPGAAHVHIVAGVPAGSGLGTSASVTVALLAALHALRDERPEPDALALAAHAVETGLGLQSGVQDQLAAAHGGVRLYDITYPSLTAMSALGPQDQEVLDALADRLLTVYLGQPHVSGAMHDTVIADLERQDPEPVLGPMRDAARAAMGALRAGDLLAYGRALRAHHEAQRRLHPGLVGSVASAVEAVASAGGGLGWKVNGAGGEGGSMVVLGPADAGARTALREAIERIPGCRILPLRPSPEGVVVRASA